MKLTATITKPYLTSKYKVQISDEQGHSYTKEEPLFIESVLARFDSTFLLTAKIRAQSAMKSIYKSEKYTPKVYKVALDDWEC
jgi:hypothetical protein